jgi:hypothetical protein
MSVNFSNSSSSIRGISQGQKNTLGTAIAVRSIRLDNYCDRMGIRPIGIKIDVEGAEGMVSEGMRKDRNTWCVVDFHGHLMSSTSRVRGYRKIIEGARDVRFICGWDGTTPILRDHQYSFGQRIKSLPSTNYFTFFAMF